MREISLTQGQVALVDNADYNWLNQYRWYADNKRGHFYAVRNSSTVEGEKYLIYMHREILELKRGDRQQGDHINHNTLDNQGNNLRICTSLENRFNQKSQQNSSSKYKGVSWKKEAKKWESCIRIDGKKKHLGYFISEELAALAYDFAALKYHREFAHFNFN